MKEIVEVPNIPLRPRDAHKGKFGRVFIIAGSLGMTGAACLTTLACLRAGAGLVTLGVPRSLLPIVATKLTSSMTYPLSETKEQTFSKESISEILEFSKNMDVVAIGPGISQHPKTKEMVIEVVSKLEKPLIIDADGLNNLVGNIDILKYRKNITIITPHPGEFSRLINKPISYIASNKIELAGEFSKKYKCIVVLKFAPTIVTDGEKYFINTTGNPGMATGGSGDVLTGVITGLLAQKIHPFNASQIGVWIHGYAGDLASQEKGEISMIADDIIDYLPSAFKFIYGDK